ncbi:TonB-dependent receptor [Xylophilus sp. GOD-11R]|uniref:TonB-dependent receptor family protein n=1 Tax=Xylophilus sp. GOD-11R TaxID=3089814 RepID=UPI00298BCD61|nr:TonB-dependent receptor [Xylophilus sp. GOD-11R]WPB57514.1 TonB-dependent receptor [Xylophilus sp. GOD-11R]
MPFLSIHRLPVSNRRRLSRLTVLLAAASVTSTTWAQSSTGVLPEVAVRGSAEAQRRFDSAASQSSVAVDGFRTAAPLVNLSELLVGQPGVVVQDRQNYAQDLQISVRGFGSRSTFGVRGVRILVDGIPATAPDGQGQAATAQLPSAERIDLLRGPLAQLYGNSAGGVVQVFTREPRPGGGASASVAAGAYGLRVAGASFDFGDRTLGGLLDISHMQTDGWRDHSAAERTHLNGKLVARPSADTKITALINLFDQPRAQDPLGLTAAQFRTDPRQSVAVSDVFNTRKSIAQNQLGLVLEQRLGPQDRVEARVYGGTRDVTQYLSFSGAATNSAGGVVDLGRRYGGAALSWTHTIPTASGLPLSWTAGLAADRQREQRQGFVNDNGVSGALRRDEVDRAGNTDAFAQIDWQATDRWRFIAGLRASRVRLAVDDGYVTAVNPNDSGDREYRQTSPALGVVWSVADNLNLYANAGQGFETPTLAEMAYSVAGTGPNFGLGAARSRQFEVGAKWQAERLRLEAALFEARSRNEIVPAATINGRTVYQNADSVVRRGAELAVVGKPFGSMRWTPRLAYTRLDAYFDSAYSTAGGAAVARGNQLPGTAKDTAQLVLDAEPGFGWRVGADVSLSAKAFADDLNTQSAAGYGTVALRAGREFRAGGVRWYAWGRLDNLFDRSYVGSMIVNDGNSRFYESAPGRRLTVGLRGQFE